MRIGLVCALAACGIAACSYDYDALKGGAATNGRPGTAGDSGSAGSGGAAGTGGDGVGGDGGAPGEGGRGATGGGAGAGGVSGAAGQGGGAAGQGGAGGTGAVAGRGGVGGVAGSAAGAGGGGGAAGGAGGATGSGGTGGAGGVPEVDLVLWYKFDDGIGNVAVDSSTAAGAPRNGTLTAAGTGGAATFSTTHQVGTHAVALTANGATGGGYVVVPSLHDVAPGAITLSVWVFVNTAQPWQRVIDIGSSTTDNIALTTNNGSNAVRFIIRKGGVQQELASTVVLPLASWHHLVVVLPEGSPYTGELYVDGLPVAANPAMTLHAADLGPTTSNFLGKSQFTVDPYFSGLIDDFRVYRRALSRAQIMALASAR